jgi:hypothetical protein
MKTHPEWLLRLSLLLAVTSIATVQPVRASELFQFQASIPLESNRTAHARLWIPPRADRVRGVIFGGMWDAACDTAVRRAFAGEKLAIVLTESSDEHLSALLAQLARTSGYPEIAVAPLVQSAPAVEQTIKVSE